MMKCRNQFAVKGNAVLFTDLAIKHNPHTKHPVVFGKGKIIYKIQPVYLFYYIGNDAEGKALFDCIDLARLKFRKE